MLFCLASESEPFAGGSSSASVKSKKTLKNAHPSQTSGSNKRFRRQNLNVCIWNTKSQNTGPAHRFDTSKTRQTMHSGQTHKFARYYYYYELLF